MHVKACERDWVHPGIFYHKNQAERRKRCEA
nr:MAG TPA: hypothetical protein [Caudoviricetes sp.]